MRGTCEITLKDKRNRIVHHEKSHNVVTNFFDEYYKELGPIKGLPYNYAVEDMIGGILLFQNTIDDDPDNVLLPAGNKMVGNGATLIVHGSGAAVKELGTYMADETKWLDNNTYQMKYEWAPSQAVGTIRAVCLTSRAHGFMGEGNEESMAQRSTPDSSQSNYEHFRQNFLNLGYNQGHNVGGRRIHTSYNNIAYSLVDNVTDGKVLVHKYMAPMSNIEFRWGSSNHGAQLLDTVSYNIPEECMEDIRTYQSSAHAVPSMSEDGKIFFVIGKWGDWNNTAYRTLLVNSTNPYVYCFTYDIADDSFSYKRINVYSYYNKPTSFKGFYDGKYLLVCPSAYYSQSYYDGQHASVIDTDELTMKDLGAQTTRTGHYVSLYRCNDHQFYLWVAGRYAVGDWYYGTKVDAERGVWSPINMTASYYCDSAFQPKGTKLVGIPDNNPMYFNRHGDYLATIYNLPSAVTKTSDLTMQITYTVTFGE